MNDIAQLKRHQELVRKASAAIGSSPHCHHDFPLLALARSFNAKRLGKPEAISQFAQAVFFDLGNLANSAGRLEWIRQQCLVANADGSLWMQLAALDIEFALVKMTSLADHFCSLLAIEFASIPKNRSKSMSALLSWAEDSEPQVDPNLIQTLRDSCLLHPDSWFKDVRSVRNKLVHRGARCEIFPDYTDGTMFQIVGRNNEELIPDLPYLRAAGRGVVWWERYFPLLWAQLIHTQSVIVASIIPGSSRPSGSFLQCMGLPVVGQWLRQLDGAIVHQLSISSWPTQGT